MITTVVAQIVDQLGHAMWEWRGSFGGRHVERFEAHPAANFLDVQPGDIPVELRHGGERLGSVAYLEHNIAGCTDLTAVCLLDDVEPEEVDGLYCSAEVGGTKRLGDLTVEDCKLQAVALLGQTAGVNARPVTAYSGDFRHSWERERWARRPKVLDRAAAACPYEYRSARCELRINRPAPARVSDDWSPDLAIAPRSGSGHRRWIDGQWVEIEYWPGHGRILSVR
jgi:hypothetical protein